MISLAALTVAGGHSGIVHARAGPELSDLALFVVAGVGVWLVRRALRRRFADRPRPRPRNKD
jgi:ABC-type nickel/cobalt efflux system permease component RcnA